MLEVKDLAVSYGRVQAVKGISFTVEQGQVVLDDIVSCHKPRRLRQFRKFADEGSHRPFLQRLLAVFTPEHHAETEDYSARDRLDVDEQPLRGQKSMRLIHGVLEKYGTAEAVLFS